MNAQPQNHQQNVDAQEIAKFEAVASRWWDLEGEFKPLHRINPLRLGYIAQRSNGLFGKKVLDVGCGGGILAESMAREGAIVTGLDMGAEPLAVARLHAQESGVTLDYVQQTVEAHAEQYAGHYDVVTCMEMLEHVPDPRSVVHACAQLVKPGGVGVFIVPSNILESHSDTIKTYIKEHVSLKMFLTLPETIFKSKDSGKSIMVLENVKPSEDNRDVLLLKVPDFKNANAIKTFLNDLNNWYDNGENETK